jgi:ArsR family transcriptional regulator
MLSSEDLARVLDAVSDPVRLEIIFLLDKGERKNVGEIASRFRLSRPAISHHLKVLKDAGIVRSEKSGQEIYYWLDSKQVVASLRALADKIERESLSNEQ